MSSQSRNGARGAAVRGVSSASGRRSGPTTSMNSSTSAANRTSPNRVVGLIQATIQGLAVEDRRDRPGVRPGDDREQRHDDRQRPRPPAIGQPPGRHRGQDHERREHRQHLTGGRAGRWARCLSPSSSPRPRHRRTSDRRAGRRSRTGSPAGRGAAARRSARGDRPCPRAACPRPSGGGARRRSRRYRRAGSRGWPPATTTRRRARGCRSRASAIEGRARP